MADNSLKGIKHRIKSVNNTMKITNAMELVASSKLKKAKEKFENNKHYFDTLYNTIVYIAKNSTDRTSFYLKESSVNNSLYIIISGDRGLAGSYNSNVLKLSVNNINKDHDKLICFGNKARDYFKRYGYDVIHSDESAADNLSVDNLYGASKLIVDLFKNKTVGKVFLVYTDFISSLTQEPLIKQVFPLYFNEEEIKDKEFMGSMEYEPNIESFFENIIPNYISGMLYGALIDSYAAEQASRRNAMESANDNAKELIAKLDLLYNRARQAAITQEISEIVGGAEALK